MFHENKDGLIDFICVWTVIIFCYLLKNHTIVYSSLTLYISSYGSLEKIQDYNTSNIYLILLQTNVENI
jgi:hypothetical protein